MFYNINNDFYGIFDVDGLEGMVPVVSKIKKGFKYLLFSVNKDTGETSFDFVGEKIYAEKYYQYFDAKRAIGFDIFLCEVKKMALWEHDDDKR